MPAIFGSEVFPSPVLEQIGEEAGVRYVDVLRDDDLPGEPGEAEHSWLGLMRFDYVTITEALGGDATRPARGGRRRPGARPGASTRSERRRRHPSWSAWTRVTCGYGAEPVLVDVDLSVAAGRVRRAWSGRRAPARPRCCGR